MVTSNSTTAAPITTTVTCTCGTLVEGDGKALHRCIQRDSQTNKVVSREWVGFFDGRPVCYHADRPECSAQLDAYVYELLTHTATETADMAADAAAELSSGGSLLVEPIACIECDGEGRVPSHDCCGDQAGGWAVTCDFCNGTGTVDPPAPEPPADDDWTPGGPYARCDGAFPGIACTNAPDTTGLCDHCRQTLDRIAWAARYPDIDERWIAAGREWEQRSARIRAGVLAAVAKLDPPTDPDPGPPPWDQMSALCTCGAPAAHVIPVGRLTQPACTTCYSALMYPPVVRRALAKVAA